MSQLHRLKTSGRVTGVAVVDNSDNHCYLFNRQDARSKYSETHPQPLPLSCRVSQNYAGMMRLKMEHTEKSRVKASTPA
ncbi:hypothetical protein BaRGS_00038366 [Batillaria attramentaria]|uniref:Uncharacterized protein n=1 Tax=Batillaria attramentaria TaxID=370345 RepID=A0ABD0J616_9CAEN